MHGAPHQTNCPPRHIGNACDRAGADVAVRHYHTRRALHGRGIERRDGAPRSTGVAAAARGQRHRREPAGRGNVDRRGGRGQGAARRFEVVDQRRSPGAQSFVDADHALSTRRNRPAAPDRHVAERDRDARQEALSHAGGRDRSGQDQPRGRSRLWRDRRDDRPRRAAIAGQARRGEVHARDVSRRGSSGDRRRGWPCRDHHGECGADHAARRSRNAARDRPDGTDAPPGHAGRTDGRRKRICGFLGRVVLGVVCAVGYAAADPAEV